MFPNILGRPRLHVRDVTVALLATLLVCVSPSAQPVFGDLGEKVQKELDNNPFLEKEGLSVRVVEEQNGYVALEVYEGPYVLRLDIQRGLDIDNPSNSDLSVLEARGGEASRRALNALRKSVSYLRQMEGVKEVLVQAVTNTPDDLFQKGMSQYHSHNYDEAVKSLRGAADHRHTQAQFILRSIYATCMDPAHCDGERALHYAEKVIDADTNQTDLPPWSRLSALAAASGEPV